MNAGVLRDAPGAIWHKSGEPVGHPPAPHAATLHSARAATPCGSANRTAPVALAPLPCDGPMPLLHRMAAALNRVIAASSLVSTKPLLDVRDFGWTAELRRRWAEIRVEALALTGPDFSPSASGTVPLWRDGGAIGEWLARCPRTAEAIAAVPGLHSAAFAVLSPGAHIGPTRSATKALITCQLGVTVPRDGDVRMRLRDRVVRWAEGETLLFDETCPHEVWNDSRDARIVLLVRFARPLRQPGRWIADRVLRRLGA